MFKKKKRFTSPTEICGLEAERQQEGTGGWKTNDLLGLILLLDYLTKNEKKKESKSKKLTCWVILLQPPSLSFAEYEQVVNIHAILEGKSVNFTISLHTYEQGLHLTI